MTPPSPTDRVIVDGLAWQRKYLEDRSGSWLELAGPFGELVVEQEREEGFSARWWPPGIRSGEAVLIRDGLKTQRGAMRAAVAYIQTLAQALDPPPKPAGRRAPKP